VCRRCRVLNLDGLVQQESGCRLRDNLTLRVRPFFHLRVAALIACFQRSSGWGCRISGTSLRQRVFRLPRTPSVSHSEIGLIAHVAPGVVGQPLLFAGRPSGKIPWCLHFLPNVKDEPRPSLARLVQHDDLDSAASFRKAFDSTSRDSEGRWLWRLVRQ